MGNRVLLCDPNPFQSLTPDGLASSPGLFFFAPTGAGYGDCAAHTPRVTARERPAVMASRVRDPTPAIAGGPASVNYPPLVWRMGGQILSDDRANDTVNETK